MITRLLRLTRVVGGQVTLFALVFTMCCLSWPAYAAQPDFFPSDDRTTVFDLIHGPDLVEVILETDLVRLMDNKMTENYQSATLSFNDEQGRSHAFQTKIRPRGNYRRRVCDFPPIMVKFDKEKLVGANLQPHNKLKLVTHCLDDRGAGHENLLKEYLAYQMYAELTDQSFRTQLIRITYQDTEGKLNRIRRYAVLLEDTDEMAQRLGGEECECLNPQEDQMDMHLEGIHAMYQYMIGNEDWSLMMNRNIKMVKPPSGKNWKPVPYDFDFSGLVNASYAVPNVQLGVRAVQDRLYLGMPISDTEMKYLFDYFRAKEADLLLLVETCKYLSRGGRNELIRYLDSFYAQLDYLESEVGRDLYQVMSSNVLPIDPEAGVSSGR